MSASIVLRFKAFLFDYIFIFIYLLLLFLASAFIFPALQRLFTGSLLVSQLVSFIVVTVPVSLYFIISDSTMVGQSFGKKKVGIKVVTKNGASLSLLQSAYRTVLKFLPWEMGHYVAYRFVLLGDDPIPSQLYVINGIIYSFILAYLITALVTKNKQTLYDLIAKTFVVKTNS